MVNLINFYLDNLENHVDAILKTYNLRKKDYLLIKAADNDINTSEYTKTDFLDLLITTLIKFIIFLILTEKL